MDNLFYGTLVFSLASMVVLSFLFFASHLHDLIHGVGFKWLSVAGIIMMVILLTCSLSSLKLVWKAGPEKFNALYSKSHFALDR